LEIRAEAIRKFGGSDGIREMTLLESAVSAPQATFGGQSPYKDLTDVAAANLFYVCRNHPFIDGNKRAALAACLVFLRLNGLQPTDDGTVTKLAPIGANWAMTTLAGSPGIAGSAAKFNFPAGVASDASGTLFLADSALDTIRLGHRENTPAVIVTSNPGLDFTRGEFSFTLTGPPGQSVVVETSAGLPQWQPIWTNTFRSASEERAGGSLNFGHARSGATPVRFFRARTP
jgi:death-on-curing protein